MSQNNSKILVVGATGTVGSALVKELVAAGEQVVAATRDPSRDLGEGVQTVRYDFDDPSTFDAALQGVDRIFYLTRPADPRAAEVAKPLFDKARELGIRHIVNMSALGVDADDSIAMRQVELLLEGSDVPYTLLRPNWFMQNFSTGGYSGTIREQDALFLPAGDAATSFIDIRDIAAVAARVLIDGGHHGKAYALTGPESLTFGQLVQTVSKAAGKTVTYVPIADEDFAAALGAQHMPGYVVDFMLMLFGAMRAGYNAPISGDVHAVLGREPRSLAAFADESAASFASPVTA